MSNNNGGHWYTATGEARHFVPKKTGQGNRPTTIADARKEGLLPSVTSVLQILDKPALTDWKIRMAVLAVVTAPDVPGEGLDSKITRVLESEQQQEEEAQKARDWGVMIHDALEAYFLGKEVEPELKPWIMPAANALCARGSLVCAEKILVGRGYAGRTDLILEAPDHWLMVDWKTAKKLPEKGPWPEHVLQLSGAYAPAYHRMIETDPHMMQKPIRCANCYLSSVEQGKFVLFDHDPDWQKVYNTGFKRLLEFWCYWKNYAPPGVTL